MEKTRYDLKNSTEMSTLASRVFDLWADRKRDRSTVSVDGLYHALRARGYTYKRKTLQGLLERLEAVGIGELMRSKDGKPVLLKNIKKSLIEIGKGTGDALKKEPLSVTSGVISDNEGTMVVIIQTKGHQVKLVIPAEMNKGDIADILSKFSY